MQPTLFLTTIALLAAANASVLAGERSQEREPERRQTSKQRSPAGFDHGMQPVAHDATADAPGYGWRYFSDPVTSRAVVISPQGDYYYSRGQGLRWIAAEQI